MNLSYWAHLLQGNMSKKDPQKSHHDWVEVNLATIRRLERENLKLREEKLDRENDIKALKEENIALKRRVQDLELKMRVLKSFQ